MFYPSKRFCGNCQSWDKYDEMEMSVVLRPAKKYVDHDLLFPELSLVDLLIFSRSELPFYCFPDGLPKPKKKGKRGQQQAVRISGDLS